MANNTEGQLVDLWNEEEESSGVKGWLEENISKKGLESYAGKVKETIADIQSGAYEDVNVEAPGLGPLVENVALGPVASFKSAAQGVKFFQKALETGSKQWKSLWKKWGDHTYKGFDALENVIRKELRKYQGIAAKEAPIAKGSKVGGRQRHTPREAELELTEGLGQGTDILSSRARVPGSPGIKKSKFERY